MSVETSNIEHILHKASEAAKQAVSSTPLMPPSVFSLDTKVMRSLQLNCPKLQTLHLTGYPSWKRRVLERCLDIFATRFESEAAPVLDEPPVIYLVYLISTKNGFEIQTHFRVDYVNAGIPCTNIVGGFGFTRPSLTALEVELSESEATHRDLAVKWGIEQATASVAETLSGASIDRSTFQDKVSQMSAHFPASDLASVVASSIIC